MRSTRFLAPAFLSDEDSRKITSEHPQLMNPNLASLTRSQFRALSLAAALGTVIVPVQAAPSTWANLGTDWNTAGNWSAGVPGQAGSVQSGADLATFTSSATRVTPNLTQDWTVNGLLIGNASGSYNIGSTGSPILSIAGAGVTITNGGSTTISPVVRLVNGQTWTTGDTALTLAGGLEVNTASALTLTNTTAIVVQGTVQGFSSTITGNAASPSASASSLILSGTGSINVTGLIRNNGLGTSTTGVGTQNGFSGTLTLGNVNNSFTGGVDVQGGTVVLAGNAASGANGVLGNATSAAVLGTNGAGTFADVKVVTSGAYSVDRNITVRALGVSTVQNVTIGGTNTSGIATYSGAVGLGRTSTLTAASSGRVDFTGVISTTSGTAGVNVSGGGTVRLAGANTYTGTTAVSAGTVLLVDNTTGSGTGTGSVTVASGATLGGGGIITPGTGNSLSISGIVAPGVTAGGLGTLTFDSGSTTATVATFASGASFAFDITAGVSSDKISLINGAAGDFAFNNNTIAFTVSGSLIAGQTYTLFSSNVASAYSGLTFDGSNKVTNGVAFTGLGANFQSASYISLVGNNLVLTTVSAVPEPGTYALMAGAGALVASVLYRRRNQTRDSRA